MNSPNTSDSASHYFDVDPDDLSRLGSAPREVAWRTHGRDLSAQSDRGVFSYAGLDKGTAVLFSLTPMPPPAGTFLDLGCGWGSIALTLANLSPEATVWALDVNPRARELTTANASRLGARNVKVCDPADVPADIEFDLIWSNPPIRIGKEALHRILLTWLGRLSASGVAFLVVQKHLGADSLAEWLTRQGYAVERVGSKKGFRVLRISAQ